MQTAALPALTGQRAEIVAMAETDREDMLTRLADEITSAAGNASADLVAEMVGLFREVALRQTDSSWWLNNVTYAMAPTVARLFTAEDKARHAAIRAAR